jgi:iron complex outermembrane recepter protein
MNRVSFLGVMVLAITLSGISSPSYAQAPPAQNSDTGSSTGVEGGGLAEVVVTAQKREQSLNDVPISIAAYSQETLDLQDVKSLSDLATMTPGLDYRDFGGLNSITIRGISQNSGGGTTSTGSNTTAVYIDDAPIQVRAGQVSIPTPVPSIFDLDRVEVLRGPQGTLFGADAEGGAVRFITQQPSLTEDSGYARGELSGTTGGGPNNEAGAAYGGPIVPDELGFRVSAYEREDGGYIDNYSPLNGGYNQNASNSIDTDVVQAALLFKPQEALQIAASFFYQREADNNAPLFDPTISNLSENELIGNKVLIEPYEDSFFVPSVRIAGDLGWAQLTSVSTYLHRDVSEVYDYTYVVPGIFGGPYPTSASEAQSAVLGSRDQNFVQEIRLQSPNNSSPLDWVVGAYYANLKQGDYQTIYSPTLPSFILTKYGEPIETVLGENLLPGDLSFIESQIFRDTSYAGFANVQYKFMKQWALDVGVRVERLNNALDSNLNGPLVGLQAQSGSVTATEVAPRFGVNYYVAPENMLYAAAAKGYRPGGENVAVSIPTSACEAQLAAYGPVTTFKPDSLWSYELGSKNQLFNARLNVDASVYYIKWSDIQSSIYFPACTTSLTANLGSARSTGFDLALTAAPTDNLSLALAVGYTDATYTSTSYAASVLLLAREGQQISDISPWNISAGFIYRTSISSTMKGYIHVEQRYSSENHGELPVMDPTNVAYDPNITHDQAQNQLNAQLGVLKGKADVSIFANNVFNKHPLLNEYLGLVYDATGASTIHPRVIGVQGRVRW